MNPKGNPSSLKPRQKGSKNKFTLLKESFLNAFEEIGGKKELARWAKNPRNRGHFYAMIAKMLPHKVEGELDASLAVTVVKIPAKLPKGHLASDSL